ncbi:hypothetical protein [Melittangium boletus]|uniref:hypothetical protein n=1 Tax=Melittangium boletus TaxID=83453 RepID=UPI003DA2AC4A
MLTDQALSDDLGRRKSCVLPSIVDDPRYKEGSLKYVFALHNHPYAATLSDNDIADIVAKGLKHGFEVEAKGAKVRLAVIAFFSESSDPRQPRCDGFFQYIPLTSQILKWSNTSDGWKCQQTGSVKWLNGTEFRVDRKNAPCQESTGSSP